MYLSFHAYGQYILYPWGYEARDTADQRDLHSMAQAAHQAMQRVNGGKRYKVGTSAKLLYPAAGKKNRHA